MDSIFANLRLCEAELPLGVRPADIFAAGYLYTVSEVKKLLPHDGSRLPNEFLMANGSAKNGAKAWCSRASGFLDETAVRGWFQMYLEWYKSLCRIVHHPKPCALLQAIG